MNSLMANDKLLVVRLVLRDILQMANIIIFFWQAKHGFSIPSSSLSLSSIEYTMKISRAVINQLAKHSFMDEKKTKLYFMDRDGLTISHDISFLLQMKWKFVA